MTKLTNAFTIMKRNYLFILCSMFALQMPAQDFNEHFEDKSLRLDYIMAGNDKTQAIYLEQMFKTNNWAGRRTRLKENHLKGNGQIVVTSHDTGDTLYVNSFSTLFQEWQTTEEATRVNKAFESSYLIPFPKHEVDVTITLTDTHQQISSQLRHTVNPHDILIRPCDEKHDTPHQYIIKNGPSEKCVDIAFVAEGYTQAEMPQFYAEAQRAADALFGHEPFKSLKQKFNVVAVAAASADAGPCIPRENKWTKGTTGTHYDMFYVDRYLTTQSMHKIYDLLGNIPFEQIVILVNASTYGGGGIYNQVTTCTTRHNTFKQVLVHEFGHGYAGLGDEYFYDDQYVTMYPADTEPWEPNLTTLVNFESKWKDMLPKGVAVPTPPADIPNFKTIKPGDKKAFKAINEATQRVGVYEGGGYQTKGVYRPAQECRMKINEVDHFCPVCSRAITRITDFYTGN